MYPPHHFGGYEQVWQSAVAHLRTGGHDLQVLATTFRHPGVPDGDEPGVDRSLRWYWQDHEFVRLGLRERLAVERHNHAVLDRHLRALRPDAVSFWSMGGMSHTLIEHVRRRGIPIVSFVHDPWLGYGRDTDQWGRIFRGRGRRAGALVERLTGLPTTVDYAASGRYVFVSEFVRRRTAELGLGLADTAVAPSGISLAFLDAAGAAAPPPSWRWDLLYVGRLHPDKGIEDAVRALALLPEEASLTVAGSWDARDEAALAGLVANLGLASRVTMLGQCPPAELRALYRSADLLLFPARWEEPWGLVPLEAMASGCPVVATGRGGSGEYLRSGENCVLVPAQNPDALASAVRMLAADDGLRQRLRTGGAAAAARHTEAHFNAAVERHVVEVASAGAGATRRS